MELSTAHPLKRYVSSLLTCILMGVQMTVAQLHTWKVTKKSINLRARSRRQPQQAMADVGYPGRFMYGHLGRRAYNRGERKAASTH